MTTTRRILVFDSGVGGLSILKAIRQRLPTQDYVYASDNAAFPYGLKTRDYLVERVDKVLRALIKARRPDIIVIACNTASTVALPVIRSHFTAPVVGVVPAIKPAAAISRSGVIGLLGTPGTVERAYTQQLIDDFASHCTVVKVGSSRLVEIAEQALRGQAASTQELRNILAPLFQSESLDTVVLACTHFPLITDELAAAAPRPITWVDSGEAIARRVASFTESITVTESTTVTETTTPGDSTEQDSANPGHTGHTQAIFTSPDTALKQLKPALKRFACEAVSVLEI